VAEVEVPHASEARILALPTSTATLMPMNGASRAGGICDTAGNGVIGSATYTGLQF